MATAEARRAAPEAALPLHFRRLGHGLVAIRPVVARDTAATHFHCQVATANLATGDITPSEQHPPTDAELAEIEAHLAEIRRRHAEVDRQAGFSLLERMEEVRRLVKNGVYAEDPGLLDDLVLACLDLRDTIARSRIG